MLAFKQIVAALLEPLGLVLSLLLLAWVLLRRHKKSAQGYLAAGLLLLWLSATAALPLAVLGLIEQRFQPITAAQLASTQAVVVLGGGRNLGAQEYGGATLSPLALERLRYALLLVRGKTQLLLFSGGSGEVGPEADPAMSEAAIARAIAAQWQQHMELESQSRDTNGNAQLSAQWLAQRQIRRIALVSHVWHMPRAQLAFEQAGLEVVPAPMGYRASRPRQLKDYLPSAQGLELSQVLVHEALGWLWQRLGKR